MSLDLRNLNQRYGSELRAYEQELEEQGTCVRAVYDQADEPLGYYERRERRQGEMWTVFYDDTRAVLTTLRRLSQVWGWVVAAALLALVVAAVWCPVGVTK